MYVFSFKLLQQKGKGIKTLKILRTQKKGVPVVDSISFILDSNNPMTSKIHKKIIRSFELQVIRIEIALNLKIVNFLDVMLDLDNGTFKHFSKSNLAPTYININSNHQDQY